MQFNIGKFNILKLGKNADIKADYNYIAPSYDQPITDTGVVRDLGLMGNSSGNYNDHISKVYSKVSQRAGLLLCKLRNHSLEHMRFLWKTYLQPLID